MKGDFKVYFINVIMQDYRFLFFRFMMSFILSFLPTNIKDKVNTS